MLDVRPSNMENLNSREYLEKIKVQVLTNLERTRHAPSVQLTDVGKAFTEQQEEQDAMLDDMEEDGIGMDRRETQRRWERRVEKEGELSDSEDEEMTGNLGVRPQMGKKRRRNEHNFREGGTSGNGTPVHAGSAAPSEAGDSTSIAPTSGPLGYHGEHDEELDALRREDDHDEDVEMADESALRDPPEKVQEVGGIVSAGTDGDEMRDAIAERKRKPQAGKPMIMSGTSTPTTDDKSAAADAFAADFPPASSGAAATQTTLDAPPKPMPEVEKSAAADATPAAADESRVDDGTPKTALDTAPSTENN